MPSDTGGERNDVTAAVDRLIADHWCVSSEKRGLTSVWRELTSVTCELTSERVSSYITVTACDMGALHVKEFQCAISSYSLMPVS
jgi:hypothetical protein